MGEYFSRIFGGLPGIGGLYQRAEGLLKGTLKADESTYSEKRATRLFIVLAMMVMTFIDFAYNKCVMRETLFFGWLGFAGYDGYRITKEKKDLKTNDAKPDQPVVPPAGV